MRRRIKQRDTQNLQPAFTRRGGFTLIELVLVMALLVVAISVTAPVLSRFFRGRTLDSEASNSRHRVSESTKSRDSNIWRILSCRSAAFIVCRCCAFVPAFLFPRSLFYFAAIVSITASVTDLTSDSRSISAPLPLLPSHGVGVDAA